MNAHLSSLVSISIEKNYCT